jgi:predicted esterase
MLLVALPAAAMAQVPPASDSGTTVEHVVSDADPTQRYAMFLPPQYDPAACWPLLIVMDPRGRAMVPLARLRPAAARYGYLIVSSYNTLSDGSGEPNVAAVNAILGDVEGLAAVDCTRLYLVGLSGTARMAWEFAFRLEGRVPAVIGFGAGLPWGVPAFRIAVQQLGTPFSYFGGAGQTDYNYHELRALDRTLDEIGIRHSIEFYPGPHDWPPESQFLRAVEWLELDAIRRGLRTDSTALVARLFAQRLSEAEFALHDGRGYRALLLYRALREDFEGLHDVGRVPQIVDSLAGAPDVQATEARLEELAGEHQRYRDRLGDFVQTVELSTRPMTQEQAVTHLQIERLQQRAENPADTLDMLAALRMLATAFVHTSFYEPRRYFEERDLHRALLMLEVAQAIRPDEASVCYTLARAYAGLGRKGNAVAALESMAASVRLDPDRLERDPHLTALRDYPAFLAFVARLKRDG